jgi:hypothetical protein
MVFRMGVWVGSIQGGGIAFGLPLVMVMRHPARWC